MMSNTAKSDPIVSNVEQQLSQLKQMEPRKLLRMPPYSEIKFNVADQKHWMGIWREDKSDGSVLFVAQCRNPVSQDTVAHGFYLDSSTACRPAREEDLRPYR